MPQRGLRGSTGTLKGLLQWGAAPLGAVLLVILFAGTARAQGGEADVFVSRAIAAYEEKRYAEALEALREALGHDPNNVDALYYTGLVRVALGQLNEAVQPLEQARSRAPQDETILFQLGVVYFSLAKYEQAEPLLEQVFATTPARDSLGYYVGFMRYRKQNYQGALRAFRAGSTTDPNIQQLTRFYSGLTLAVLGLPERAAAEIEESIKLQPASPLTGPAERLRGAVAARARERERPFRAELRVGGLFDDNVPVTPRPFPAEPLVTVLRGRRKESSGWLSSARLDYSFLRGSDYDFLRRWGLGALEATATYSLFVSYNNDLPKFNVVDQLVGLGTTYGGEVQGYRYQLALQYAYDILSLGGNEFVQRHTITPLVTLVEDPNNLTAFQARYQEKDFRQPRTTPRQERRDGTNWLWGFTHLWRGADLRDIFRFGRATPGDTYQLRLGYQWDFDDTDGPKVRGRNFSYFGNRVLAGVQYAVPEPPAWIQPFGVNWGGLRLRYDFDVHLRDYRHKNTVLPSPAPGTKARQDNEYTHVFGFTLPLPYHLLNSKEDLFTLAGEYQRTVSRSNLAVFSFNRNVVSLSVSWSY